MKRNCFLLTFFLTGFSLVANQHSLRNTYLLACNEGVYEINLEPRSDCEELAEDSDEAGLAGYSFAHTGNFICSLGN